MIGARRSTKTVLKPSSSTTCAPRERAEEGGGGGWSVEGAVRVGRGLRRGDSRSREQMPGEVPGASSAEAAREGTCAWCVPRALRPQLPGKPRARPLPRCWPLAWVRGGRRGPWRGLSPRAASRSAPRPGAQRRGLLSFRAAGGGLLRPRRASTLLRRCSGVRRSGLSLEMVQRGGRGAVLSQVGGPCQPAAQLSPAAACARGRRRRASRASRRRTRPARLGSRRRR